MKSLRICLGLCAVAVCLSAFAQRPPKGYNYAYGLFLIHISEPTRH